MPKLPVIPTKINTTTGVGVPGGFVGTPISPAAESSKYLNAARDTNAQLAQVNKLSESNPLTAKKLESTKKKLQNQAALYSKKASESAKAPDFTNPTSIPKIPDTPKIEVPELKLPDLPPTETTVNTTNIPSPTGVG